MEAYLATVYWEEAQAVNLDDNGDCPPLMVEGELADRGVPGESQKELEGRGGKCWLVATGY